MTLEELEAEEIAEWWRALEYYGLTAAESRAVIAMRVSGGDEAAAAEWADMSPGELATQRELACGKMDRAVRLYLLCYAPPDRLENPEGELADQLTAGLAPRREGAEQQP